MKVDKVFVLAALLASSSAQSATLEGVQGDVWVGREKGFNIVQDSAELSPGDKVKVGRKSLARIVYPDGCNVDLRANSLATVAKHSPCSFKAQAGDSRPGAPFEPFVGNEWIAGLGVLGVGGGIAAAIASHPSYRTSSGFFFLPRPASP